MVDDPHDFPFLEALQRDHPTSAIGYVDADMRYVWVNERLVAMNGLAASEHIGQRIRDVLPASIGERVEVLLRGVLDSGEPVEDLVITFGAESPLPADEDSSATLRTTFIPVRDPGHEGVVAIIDLVSHGE